MVERLDVDDFGELRRLEFYCALLEHCGQFGLALALGGDVFVEVAWLRGFCVLHFVRFI